MCLWVTAVPIARGQHSRSGHQSLGALRTPGTTQQEHAPKLGGAAHPGGNTAETHATAHGGAVRGGNTAGAHSTEGPSIHCNKGKKGKVARQQSHLARALATTAKAHAHTYAPCACFGRTPGRRQSAPLRTPTFHQSSCGVPGRKRWLKRATHHGKCDGHTKYNAQASEPTRARALA